MVPSHLLISKFCLIWGQFSLFTCAC